MNGGTTKRMSYRQSALHPILSLSFSMILFFSGLCFVGHVAYWWCFLGVGFTVLLPNYRGFVFSVLGLGLLFALLTGLGMVLTKTPSMKIFAHMQRMVWLFFCAIFTLRIVPVELNRCLLQWHVPRGLAMGMLIAVRFTNVLRADIRHIRMAMRSRGVHFSWHDPGLFFRALVMPLLFRMFSMSDHLANSMETRGFGRKENPSLYHPIDWEKRDTFFLLLLLFWLGGGFYLLAIR